MPSDALLHEAQQLKDVNGHWNRWQTNIPHSRMQFSQSAERSAALPRFWKCSLQRRWMASSPFDWGVSN